MVWRAVLRLIAAESRVSVTFHARVSRPSRWKWGRTHRALWGAVGRRKGFGYWLLVGWWLVPMAFYALWGLLLIRGMVEAVRSLWRWIRPHFLRRGYLSALPPIEGRHPQYPWLRTGQETNHVRYDLQLSRRQLASGPRTGPISDWEEAERRAALWMQHWGWKDALITQSGADGGLDVLASGAAAQVKFWAKPVPRYDLQNLVGAASTLRGIEHLLFFADNGYTSEAQAWADAAGVAIFNFDEGGNPQPQNAAAARIVGATKRA